jgi:formiminoglutamase
MSNFPVILPDFSLLDFGNITCEDGNLEYAKQSCQKCFKSVLKGGKSLVLGGGHEVLCTLFRLKTAFPEQKIGIINIDAHFDNRQPENGVGASSEQDSGKLLRKAKSFSAYRDSEKFKYFEII